MADSSGRINLDGNNVMLEMAWYNSKAGLTSAAVGRRWFGPSYSRPDDPGTGSSVTVVLADLDDHGSGSGFDNRVNDLPVHATGTARQEVGDRSVQLTSQAVTKPTTRDGSGRAFLYLAWISC